MQKKAQYIKNIEELKGLSPVVQARMIAEALFKGERIEKR